MAVVLFPVNHNSPSSPVVIIQASVPDGTGYSVMTPAVVIRPIFDVVTYSVNHSAPSGPAVIPEGWLAAEGTRYSVISNVGPGRRARNGGLFPPHPTAPAPHPQHPQVAGGSRCQDGESHEK
jgi:hypothetical protein